MDKSWLVTSRRAIIETSDIEAMRHQHRSVPLSAQDGILDWRSAFLPQHCLHDGRCTSATLLYEASQELLLTQKQVGHSRLSITAEYSEA